MRPSLPPTTDTIPDHARRRRHRLQAAALPRPRRCRPLRDRRHRRAGKAPRGPRATGPGGGLTAEAALPPFALPCRLLRLSSRTSERKRARSRIHGGVRRLRSTWTLGSSPRVTVLFKRKGPAGRRPTGPLPSPQENSLRQRELFAGDLAEHLGVLRALDKIGRAHV